MHLCICLCLSGLVMVRLGFIGLGLITCLDTPLAFGTGVGNPRMCNRNYVGMELFKMYHY